MKMDQTKPSTDPRILRTRQLIRDAFVELIQEMDSEKLSVNRIAERATINRVTFYLHYRDIPDMMAKMADEMIEEIEQIVMKAPPTSSSSVREDDWHVLVELLEHMAKDADFYKVILVLNRSLVFTERLLKLLTQLITLKIERMEEDSSLSQAGIHKEVAIWYGSSALIGMIVAWLREDMPYTPHFLVQQFSLLRANRNRNAW